MKIIITHHNTWLFQRLGHPDVCMPLNHGRLRPADAGQVVHVVHHVLDDKRQDLDAHPAHVRGGHLAHKGGKRLPVLEDLLHGERACIVTS